MALSTKKDPATPAFWDTRFRDKRTPWDAASTPPDLESYLAQETGGGRVLIPGCGSAYEVRTFSEKGYEVVAIDFSAAAVERARQVLGVLQGAVILADFFSYGFGGAAFDVIYERAFLASLPRKMWPDYARRVGELLRAGGSLVGFFVYGDQKGGPPFCLKERELAGLLGDQFERIAEAAVSTSVPVFQGKERWEIWTRTMTPQRPTACSRCPQAARLTLSVERPRPRGA
jgi:SAM-dependent methyltransferase